MTVLSAAIKAIPDDIDRGRPPRRRHARAGMFRFVTLPSIRPAVVVVLTTIGIGTLKVFDIVRTMTGGNFDTSVIANEFYSQSFRSRQPGPRRRARRAAVHPGHPDRRLQHPPAARIGGTMSTTSRSGHDHAAGHAAPVAAATQGQEEAHLARGRRWRRSIIAVLWTMPTFGLLRLVVPAGAGDIQTTRLVDVLHRPAVHAGELPRRCSRTEGSVGARQLLRQLVRHRHPVGDHPDQRWRSLAAYAFAWIEFPGRDILFVAVFALQIVPHPGDADPAAHALRRRRASPARSGRSGCRTRSFALPLAIFLLHNFMKEIPAGAARGGPGRRRRARGDLLPGAAAAAHPGAGGVRHLPVPVGVERPAGRADLRRWRHRRRADHGRRWPTSAAPAARRGTCCPPARSSRSSCR